MGWFCAWASLRPLQLYVDVTICNPSTRSYANKAEKALFDEQQKEKEKAAWSVVASSNALFAAAFALCARVLAYIPPLNASMGYKDQLRNALCRLRFAGPWAVGRVRFGAAPYGTVLGCEGFSFDPRAGVHRNRPHPDAHHVREGGCRGPQGFPQAVCLSFDLAVSPAVALSPSRSPRVAPRASKRLTAFTVISIRLNY